MVCVGVSWWVWESGCLWWCGLLSLGVDLSVRLSVYVCLFVCLCVRVSVCGCVSGGRLLVACGEGWVELLFGCVRSGPCCCCNVGSVREWHARLRRCARVGGGKLDVGVFFYVCMGSCVR